MRIFTLRVVKILPWGGDREPWQTGDWGTFKYNRTYAKIPVTPPSWR